MAALGLSFALTVAEGAKVECMVLLLVADEIEQIALFHSEACSDEFLCIRLCRMA